MTVSSSATDLPTPGSISAMVDLEARLRVFDTDHVLIDNARAVWAVLEADIRAISEAYWLQWLRCFADQRVWATHETEKMIDLGVAFLRDRFLNTERRDWIESIERSVAAAYGAGVPPMALLSMISASDRTALEVLMRKMPAGDPDLVRHVDTLMRLSALESDITVEIYTGYRAYSAQVSRERLAADFRNSIGSTVERASHEGHSLRAQASQTSS
ncbi:chemotaxis protein, partial [Sphingomonas sp. FW199]